MSVILTADTHWTDKPSDEYRWEIFKWLAGYEADELIIAGDLCEAKDRHGARLVNRLCREMTKLRKFFKVILLKGNHDFLDADHPFFQFLSNVADIRFVVKPTEMKLSIGRVFFVPAGSSWDFDIPDVPWLITHATFNGAKAETGRTLTGVDPSVLSGFFGQVYSGDIHVPQSLYGGQVVYIGAPYHERFGDAFEPRVLYLTDRGVPSDLHFPAPRKHTFIITKPDDLLDERADAGDHVKVKCQMRRADYVQWRGYREQIREIAKNREWLLFGIEPLALGEEFDGGRKTDVKVKQPDDLVVGYVKKHKAGDIFLEAGRKILGEVDGC